MNEIAIKRRVYDTIAQYEDKKSKLDDALKNFEGAKTSLMASCTVNGTYGQCNISLGNIYKEELERNLIKSAWLDLYDYLDIEVIASANAKKEFIRDLEAYPPFTPENVFNTFADYVLNPRKKILEGMAEVFCSLDPYYKSHEKMKIGVDGLPKRIIIGNVNSIHGYGRDKIKDILNALAVYQGKPLVHHVEVTNFLKLCDEQPNYLLKEHDVELFKETVTYPARGVWIKRFKNGNAHLFFDKEALCDINKALNEYYGDVLPDCYDGNKPDKKQASTEIAKDLQYYPTPIDTVDSLLRDIYIKDGDKILEPSCGCGRIMDGIKKDNPNVIVHGYEFAANRVDEAREKGHMVYCCNFLEVIPAPEYDKVIMNPPFYGKHYVKHIEHALRFLKEGGVLYSILPITAELDHGMLDKYNPHWSRLPVGAFRESGTNINTVICRIFKKG